MEGASPNIVFRSASTADKEYALDCFVRAFHEVWELEGVMPDATDSELRERVRHLLGPRPRGVVSRLLGRGENMPRETIIAMEEGHRLGCLVLTMRPDMGPRTAWIDLIFVEPEERLRGVGSVIMAKADEWARARGATSLMLNVSATNLIAIHLYQSMGYSSSSFCMRKKL
jgi:GNAT superfamily N-acetyltransferase